ncbi:organic hydroperoxide resistance protein [Paenisporosarcina sp. OV554]|jgi:Ohr subfamily peroxiredoxin|uniref:organic hydroperoxide resistance protein n=1 Tax=Paenisporosarcina sp. OV554 TaxID=2135694 RepID=UPI000D3D30CF|nr:organic hydroperoxide resistance protein [Paenisporosarcina sp. OV554]PUB10949.1 Ohr subfamily peroxiredoxin [Paenisporosarcina sp. OV554]
MKKLFTATATAVGGREGRVRSQDGVIDVALAMPGVKKEATNPEQLFAAGYSACFDSALNVVSRQEKIKHGGSEVTAHVSLNQGTDGYSISVILDVLVRDVAIEVAQKLVEAAHQVCPYSRATRDNIIVELEVRTV